MYRHGWLPEGPLEAARWFYWPVEWAADESELAEAAVDWYCGVWRAD
jgi:hypothetical protein